MFDVVLAFPKMKVAVLTRDEHVVEIRYLPPAAPSVAPKNPLAEEAMKQLARYRDDPDTVFDLPLLVQGSPLEKRVWRAMGAIPRGRARTYGELARELGVDPRAIGQACGDNRLPIVIPCHRIVAADGIGGFAHMSEGYLIEAKRWLLSHEIRPEEFKLQP